MNYFKINDPVLIARIRNLRKRGKSCEAIAIAFIEEHVPGGMPVIPEESAWGGLRAVISNKKIPGWRLFAKVPTRMFRPFKDTLLEAKMESLPFVSKHEVNRILLHNYDPFPKIFFPTGAVVFCTQADDYIPPIGIKKLTPKEYRNWFSFEFSKANRLGKVIPLPTFSMIR